MTFLYNSWYVAGFPDEITASPISRTFLNQPIVLFRTSDGAVAAMTNNCPHRFAPLDQGRVVDDAIQCPYHGLKFDTRGRCLTMPDGGVAPERAHLRVYPTVERHELLWIWMGDSALADAGTIPDFAYLTDQNFGWFNGSLYARGNYQLLVDNLLDLSHSEFLHPLLSSEGWAGRNEAVVERREETIHVRNVAENDNILPIMRQMRPDMPIIGTTVQQERWDAPGLIRLSVEFYANDMEIIIPSGHFLTPESETTTHYFVRGGQGVAPGSLEFTAGMKHGVLNVFQNEDIPLIEAQQRFLGDRDLLDAQPAILKSDSSALQARRLLARRIRLETVGNGDVQTLEPPMVRTAAG